MNLAIIGSRYYKNKDKIQQIIERYKNKYKEDLTILSGGCLTGADSLAKSIAIDLNVKYIEFAPAHFKWNVYCFYPESYYSQIYSVKHFWTRNREIVEKADHILGFVYANIVAKGTMGTVEIAKQLGKKCFVFEDNNND